MTAEIAEVVGQHSIYLSTDARSQLAEARERAAVLVEVVREQGLAKSFGGGKPHVFVEGWQFLASQFGLIPDVEWTKPLENGWEARAVLRRLSDGAEIAHADAECRTDEPNWKSRPSYAVRSMAQTRAVSKVCRIALSSVMVMAGFSATPAEEMDGVTKEPPAGPKSPDEPHCPACLAINGELVGVWENDKRPFWKCKAKEACAAWDGQYAWSGWHQSFENSLADYNGGVIQAEPVDATMDTGRANRSDYIVQETMKLSGLVSGTDARLLVKPGLIQAISEGSVDAAGALGGELGSEPSEEELRTVITNLTLAEADAVAAAAASLRTYDEDDDERPF